jgi:hypothetical protein
MSFISELSDRYFAGGLSPEVVELLGPIDQERPEVQEFVERMFRLMHAEHIQARDFSEGLAWVVGNFLAGILPGAWGGIVPPITQKGRHSGIDEYLASNPWRKLAAGDRLLDLGCGFPPITTLDSAARFPDVQITGVDPSFGKFLVREQNGDYAVFTGDGTLIYFQAGANTSDAWDGLYRDPEETRRRFAASLASLRALLPDDSDELSRITSNGTELVRNPVHEFAGANVGFEQRGFGDAGLSGFDAVRCFNVLIYFDDAFRSTALKWLAETLVDGGVSVTGTDWSSSRFARYSVHQAENGAMVPREFAFSIENVRPLELVALFSLHDDDHDLGLLSKLIGVLRSDDSFRRDIDTRLDELQAEIGFCSRKTNGYLGPMPQGPNAHVLATAAEKIGSELEKDGFNERAAELLERQGYRSWVNCVGHVAIDPACLP